MNRRTFLTELDDLRVWRTRPLRDPAAVRQWAEPLLTRAYAVAPNSHLPYAGSLHWAGLDDRDPRKLAAVVTAAIASLEESTPHAIATRLADGWAATQRDLRARLKEASTDVAAAMADSGVLTGHLPFCVLAARRTTYTTPPLSADEIRARAAASWAAAESAGGFGRAAA